MHRVLIHGAIIAILSAGLIVNTPATAQNRQEDNFGFVRFAHTAIDVPALDIYIDDGSQLPLVSNLHYGQSTTYFTLPSTTRGFVAREANSGVAGNILARLVRGVKTNQSQIITAAGLLNKLALVLEPLTLVRDNTRGRARVRVFNTVWGGPYLTVTDTDGNLYGQELQYLSSSADVDVEPGTHTFSVKTASGQVLEASQSLDLASDKIYSLLIVGGMDDKPPVHLVTLVSDQEITRVRFINKSATAADIYLKGDPTPLISDLAPGASTDFITVPSSATTFYLRPSGTPPSGSELAFVNTQLRPQRDITITINGKGVATQMGITEDHLTGQTLATEVPTVATPVATAPGL